MNAGAPMSSPALPTPPLVPALDLQVDVVAAASLAWLTERLFIGTGGRWPAQVTMRFFEVG